MKTQYETIAFKIIKRIGVLSEYQNGWKKEINIVSWNGGEPKYDIRDWEPSHEHMSRGVTLSEAEMNNLLLHIREHRQQQRSESRQPGRKERDLER